MNTRPIKQFAILLFAIILASCASKPKVYTDADPEQNFSEYTSFAWASENPMTVQSDYMVNPFVGKSIMETIKTELAAKGYQFVDDNSAADMVISFSIGARDKTKVFNEPVMVNTNWRWGNQYWGPTIVNTSSTHNYVEGALAIDVFDNTRKAPVWHGVGSKNLTRDEREGKANLVAPAVTTILSSFPAR
jgi:hypothetical protein